MSVVVVYDVDDFCLRDNLYFWGTPVEYYTQLLYWKPIANIVLFDVDTHEAYELLGLTEGVSDLFPVDLNVCPKENGI